MTTQLPTRVAVLYQELEGEMVLLSLANEQYFGLDEVGAPERVNNFETTTYRI